MKLEAGRVEGFLRNPGAARVVLIHGPDGGLVAERAVALVKAVVGGTDDAFRYAEISDAGRLPGVVTERLRVAGVAIDAAAAAWVANNILGEEGAIRQTVEVLALYAGAAGRLALADVTAALTDGGEGSMQAAIDAALTGDPAGADRAITLSFEEGVSPVAVLRVLLSELMRLRVLAEGVAAAGSVGAAVSGARPPVFFKRVGVVTKALGLWSEAALTEAIRAALAAEAACKTTHVPDMAYCRQMFLGLASRARSAGRR